jgi:hypothetical protein
MSDQSTASSSAPGAPDAKPGRAAGRGKWFRVYWKLFTVGVVWLSLLVILVIWGFIARASAQTDIAECAVDHAVTGSTEPPEQPAQLKPRAEPKATVAFYQELRPATRVIEYDADDAGRLLRNGDWLEVRPGPFIAVTGGRELKAEDIHANAHVERGSVVLTVCFNRTDPDFGRPGTYSGIVSIIDPRVTRADANFTVSMAYPYWQFQIVS